MSVLLDFNCYGLLLSAKHFVKLISSLTCNDAQSREIALLQLVGPQMSVTAYLIIFYISKSRCHEVAHVLIWSLFS